MGPSSDTDLHLVPGPLADALRQALRELNAAQAWRSQADRDRLMLYTLRNLSTTAWSQGYDQGQEAARERFREFLAKR